MKKYLDNFVPASRHNDWITWVWWKPYTGDPFSMSLVLFEQMQIKNIYFWGWNPSTFLAVKAIDGSNYTPTFVANSLNFGALVWLQMWKMSSSFGQPFCSQWLGKCSPSRRVHYPIELMFLTHWLSKWVNFSPTNCHTCNLLIAMHSWVKKWCCSHWEKV